MKNNELVDLYKKTSKHSQYQILADSLKDLLPNTQLDIVSRYEKERIEYFTKKLNFDKCEIADIGANTGYFSLELIEKWRVKHVLMIEGNKSHFDFIDKSINILNYGRKVTLINNYIDFKTGSLINNIDITLLLNVLHHAGDDYDRKITSIEELKENILLSLSYLSKNSQYIVFQLGFNWKGDIQRPIFKNGTKKELIDFITTGVKDDWLIEHIGIAEKTIDGFISYNDLNSINIKRNDSLGEFLNRPLFIMRSKNYNTDIDEK